MAILKDKIDENQFGSLKGLSTTDALIEMVHDWYKATDKLGVFIRVFLIDYSKAFDLIDHNIVLEKLCSLNVPHILVQWVESFLTYRRQQVKIGDITSEWEYTNAGVPQGTKLGPLLYLVMINDLVLPCPNFKYVDYTTEYEICTDTSSNLLQSCANTTYEWSTLNNMKINTAKTKELIISLSKKELDIPPLLINGKAIKRATSAKLLGLEISDDLTWDTLTLPLSTKKHQRGFMSL